MKFLLAAIVIYAVLSVLSGRSDKEPKQSSEVKESVSEVKKTFDNVMALQVNDIKVGEGEPAFCGQTAEIKYKLTSKTGEVLHASSGMAEKIVIGSGANMRGLELGLLGMKAGGVRNIIIPSFMTSKAGEQADRKGDSVNAEVMLATLSPKVPETSMPFRILGAAVGMGPVLLCGSDAAIRADLWDGKGRKLADNLEIRFRIGRGEAYLWMETAVIGSYQGSRKTVIVPPELAAFSTGSLQKSLESLAIPGGEVLIAEIEVIK